MDVWHLVLYAVGSFLALRSLVSLMAHYKKHYRHQFALEAARSEAMRREHEKRDAQSAGRRVPAAETNDAAA